MAEHRWTIEHVAAVAPTPRAMAAAGSLASPHHWSGLGADDRALWGRCRGSSREPYDTMVDHAADTPGWKCSCPSRQSPCKHALALLMLWVADQVPTASPPAAVTAWISARDQRLSRGEMPVADAPDAPGDAAPADPSPPTSPDGDNPSSDGGPAGASDDASGGASGGDRRELEGARDDRVARMRAGLDELDRWLGDRMRSGLSDPAISRYETWDGLAARLVDAQVGALANRVRRVAGLVGASSDWHDRVLAEIGLLHLLAQAGARVPELPSDLADSVAITIGWQVRQAAVLDTAPVSGEWFVAGRSDLREDRIEVRRYWLRSLTTGRWVMLLSFAAYQQSLDASLRVGSTIEADIHLYPGNSLRGLIGRRGESSLGSISAGDGVVAGTTIAELCDEVGLAVAAEPWLDRYPATVRATPTRRDGRWVLTDRTGSLALVGQGRAIATLAAAAVDSGDVVVTVEWTPDGLLPLSVHLVDRTIDVGRRADGSFVADEIETMRVSP